MFIQDEGILLPAGRPGRGPRQLLAVVLLVLAGAGSARAAIQTQHVVIVAIDGARYSETLGDPTLAQCPRLGLDLAGIGAQPSVFRNVGVTITCPGMSAICTGTLQDIANDGSERPHLPTLFEYLRKQKGTPASLVRVVLRKPKLDVLAYSDHASYGASYGATVRTGFDSDALTYEAARADLFQYKPVLMLVHLGDTDFLGHANDWPGYLNSIRVADSLVWRLWNDIQSVPEMAGKTTLFVSNDHGRHDAAHGGFQNHGDGCDGCRRILMVMAGPDNFAGYVSQAQHDQRAIARTAGYLLGVSMPLAAGVVMDDLLLEPSMPLAVPGTGTSAPRLAIAVFPNPTRSGAEIRVSGVHPREARVELIDASGRRVATLPARGTGSDTGTWSWGGLDDTGRPVPPGRYVVRVSARGELRQAALIKLR